MTTKRQLTKAARLWSLGVIANGDDGGDEQSGIRQIAIDHAQDQLHRLGHHFGDLINEQACIDAVELQELSR